MTQPRRTARGFLRRMQMSRHHVFVFIEGKEGDGYLVGGLCERAFKNSNLSFNICMARELGHASGGKDILVDYYRHLRSRSHLKTELNGKSTQAIFFLDKDIDDMLRRKCKSNHVIYTKYYDIQNHLFKNGDFVKAVASAASIPINSIRAHVTLGNDWCSLASRRWLAWVMLCYFCQKYKVPHPNYRVVSLVNTPPCGEIDISKYRKVVRDIFRASGVSWIVFVNRLKKARTTIMRIYLNDEPDKIFKGKWYAVMLEHELQNDQAFTNNQVTGISKRISSCLATSLNFESAWADQYIEQIRTVLAQ